MEYKRTGKKKKKRKKKKRKHTDYENDWCIGYKKFISCLNLSSDVI